MSIHRKLTTVCCAAVLALGLAACSSSDKETAVSTDGGDMNGGGTDMSTQSVGDLFKVAA